MKKMNTLSVNGNSYVLEDAGAVAFDRAQALTDEQKKCARQNMDACRADDTNLGEDTWSSANTVDKLCPSFEERDSTVLCEPVGGYPLSVTSHINGDHTAVTLIHTGKNLMDMGALVSSIVTFDETTRLWSTSATTSGYWRSLLTGKDGNGGDRDVTKLIKLQPNTTYTIRVNDWRVTALNGASVTEYQAHLNIGFYTPEGQFVKNWNFMGVEDFHDQGYTCTFTTPETGYYLDIRRELNDYQVSFSSIQIELGNAYTGYEPYQGEEYTVAFGKTVSGGSYNWETGVLTDGDGIETRLTPQKISALNGTNTLYSDTGDTTVKGKATPASVIEKLTNAIIALGGNV